MGVPQKRKPKFKDLEWAEKIRDVIVNGTETDDAKLQRAVQNVQQVYPILVDNPGTKTALGLIQDAAACGQRQALKLIHLTEKVYGLVRQRDKEGRKAILLDISYEALGEAKKANDWKAVDRLVDRIAKMEGFYEAGENMANIYNILSLKAIQVTDNPAALEEDIEKADVIDLDP